MFAASVESCDSLVLGSEAVYLYACTAIFVAHLDTVVEHDCPEFMRTKLDTEGDIHQRMADSGGEPTSGLVLGWGRDYVVRRDSLGTIILKNS